MRTTYNPGRVAGFWYLLLIILGPLRLMYIPRKLFVSGDAAATIRNIATHETLFKAGIIVDLAGVVVLVLMTLAFYKLFAQVDRHLALQVVAFGGIMPALIHFAGVVSDLAALMVVRGADFLAVFSKDQQDALAILFLKLRNHENTAAEILWGVWLFPLAILIYRSRFAPRFLSVWLTLAGLGWIALSVTAVLWPASYETLLRNAQPALVGEVALTLWLVIKGAKTAAVHDAAA